MQLELFPPLTKLEPVPGPTAPEQAPKAPSGCGSDGAIGDRPPRGESTVQQIADEWNAVQHKRDQLAARVEQMGAVFLTGTEFMSMFAGTTATKLQRLAAAGKVQQMYTGKRKRYNARQILHLLLLSPGRIRRPRRQRPATKASGSANGMPARTTAADCG